jgi:hypothetical protein
VTYNRLNDFEPKPAHAHCEAEDALLRVAYELELQWGSGRIDLGVLKRLATAGKCAGHDTPTVGNSAQLSC